jgi:hypothetical protein
MMLTALLLIGVDKQHAGNQANDHMPRSLNPEPKVGSQRNAQGDTGIMGLFDKAKDLAAENADAVEDAIDKAADVVDDKTGGKHSDKIDAAAEKAKDLIDGLD